MAVAVDPSGRFAYVATAVGSVLAFTIDNKSGALTPLAAPPIESGSVPFSIAVDPSGRFVYVANNGSSNVTGYLISDNTGALTLIPGSPFAAGFAPQSVMASAKFVYVVNNGSSISAYAIGGSTGALTPVQGSPFNNPGGFAGTIDPSGRFVYVANSCTNSISAYLVAHDSGALASVSDSPFPAGSAPAAVASTGKPRRHFSEQDQSE